MTALHRAWLNEQADEARLQSIAKEPRLSVKTVEQLFLDCLFKEGEPTEKHVVAKGLTVQVGFHPIRLESKRAEVRELLRELEPNFFPGTGDGMSFLRMPFRKDQGHWGEHRDCERLLLLALALGEASYLAPKEMWAMFPGGVPYVVFKA